MSDSYNYLDKFSLQHLINRFKTFFDEKIDNAEKGAVNGIAALDDKGMVVRESLPIVELTKAEYDALPSSKNRDDVEYYITDMGVLGDSKDLYYDNTESKISANNVQDAIDKTIKLIPKNYLTSETDPTVGQWIKNITEADIDTWNNKGTYNKPAGGIPASDLASGVIPITLPANGGNSSTVNGHTVNADVPSGAKFTDTNTTYTFTGGTNKFTVTPSGGTAQNVTITPSVSKSDIGLGNVENKSSATIRGELTKANVTDALGYTPPTTDTNTWRPLGTGASDACAGNDARLSDARPPLAHTHTKSQITDFPSSLPANGGNADTVDGLHANAFQPNGQTWYYGNYEGSAGGNPYGVGFFFADGHGGWARLRADWGDDFGRGLSYMAHSDRGTDFDWKTIIDSGNIGSQSVNYASSSGNADTLDGYHHDSFIKTNDYRLSNARPADGGNADTVDGRHMDEYSGLAYEHVYNIYKPQNAGDYWYVQLSGDMWNTSLNPIRIIGYGDNCSSKTIVYSGARQWAWFGYNTAYNGHAIKGIRKTVSDRDNLYLLVSGGFNYLEIRSLNHLSVAEPCGDVGEWEEINTDDSGGFFSYYPQILGTAIVRNRNIWMSKAQLQLGTVDRSGYSDRAMIGVTDGDLHLAPYAGFGTYINQWAGNTVYFNASQCRIEGSYFSGTSEIANYAHQSHLLRTFDSEGGSHGNTWLLKCQHNLDGDGYFKLCCSNGSIGVKVDRASSAGVADSVKNAMDQNRTGVGTFEDSTLTRIANFCKFKDSNYLYAEVSSGNSYYLQWGVWSSDKRLKENIVENNDSALNKLNTIKTYSFDFKDKKWGKHTDVGIIAQDVQEVIPEAVDIIPQIEENKEFDNVLVINGDKLIPYLIKAVQELSAKNNELEERLSKLEGK